MTDQLILPLSPQYEHEGYSLADEGCSALVAEWINTHIDLVRKIWSQTHTTDKKYSSISHDSLASEIIAILTNRAFNFQSKRKLIELLPIVRKNLVRQLEKGMPIKFFLLYNGGYRASSFPDKLSLIFEPDQTELMLLYQIALLNKKISAIYEPGIEFIVVINNGVAHWVNDIPITATENYANQLKGIIDILGAGNIVSVIVQSEMVDYNPRISFEPIQPQPLLSEKEHRIVERFLGRCCNKDEAKYRSALYKLAEAKWEEDLSTITTAKDALMVRQIAHPDMLSFRPFPGGAIRAQNGSFGFHYRNNILKPTLITSQSVKEYGLKCVPYYFPFSVNNKHVNIIESVNV